MVRVSSKATFYYKRVFPIAFFGILLLVIVGPVLLGSNPAQPPPLPFFIIPAAMAVFAYVVMKKLVFDLVDEVLDDGDALIVRNGTTQDRIAFADIKNVSYSVPMNPPRVRLRIGGDVLRPVALHPLRDEPNHRRADRPHRCKAQALSGVGSSQAGRLFHRPRRPIAQCAPWVTRRRSFASAAN